MIAGKYNTALGRDMLLSFNMYTTPQTKEEPDQAIGKMEP